MPRYDRLSVDMEDLSQEEDESDVGDGGNICMEDLEVIDESCEEDYQGDDIRTKITPLKDKRSNTDLWNRIKKPTADLKNRIEKSTANVEDKVDGKRRRRRNRPFRRKRRDDAHIQTSSGGQKETIQSDDTQDELTHSRDNSAAVDLRHRLGRSKERKRSEHTGTNVSKERENNRKTLQSNSNKNDTKKTTVEIDWQKFTRIIVIEDSRLQLNEEVLCKRTGKEVLVLSKPFLALSGVTGFVSENVEKTEQNTLVICCVGISHFIKFQDFQACKDLVDHELCKNLYILKNDLRANEVCARMSSLRAELKSLLGDKTETIFSSLLPVDLLSHQIYQIKCHLKDTGHQLEFEYKQKDVIPWKKSLFDAIETFNGYLRGLESPFNRVRVSEWVFPEKGNLTLAMTKKFVDGVCLKVESSSTVAEKLADTIRDLCRLPTSKVKGKIYPMPSVTIQDEKGAELQTKGRDEKLSKRPRSQERSNETLRSHSQTRLPHESSGANRLPRGNDKDPAAKWKHLNVNSQDYEDLSSLKDAFDKDYSRFEKCFRYHPLYESDFDKYKRDASQRHRRKKTTKQMQQDFDSIWVKHLDKYKKEDWLLLKKEFVSSRGSNYDPAPVPKRQRLDEEVSEMYSYEDINISKDHRRNRLESPQRYPLRDEDIHHVIQSGDLRDTLLRGTRTRLDHEGDGRVMYADTGHIHHLDDVLKDEVVLVRSKPVIGEYDEELVTIRSRQEDGIVYEESGFLDERPTSRDHSPSEYRMERSPAEHFRIQSSSEDHRNRHRQSEMEDIRYPRGHSPAEHIRNLSAAERYSYRSPAEQHNSLSSAERHRNLSPAERLRNLSPAERLRNLSPAERHRNLSLSENPDRLGYTNDIPSVDPIERSLREYFSHMDDTTRARISHMTVGSILQKGEMEEEHHREVSYENRRHASEGQRKEFSRRESFDESRSANRDLSFEVCSNAQQPGKYRQKMERYDRASNFTDKSNLAEDDIGVHAKDYLRNNREGGTGDIPSLKTTVDKSDIREEDLMALLLAVGKLGEAIPPLRNPVELLSRKVRRYNSLGQNLRKFFVEHERDLVNTVLEVMASTDVMKLSSFHHGILKKAQTLLKLFIQPPKQSKSDLDTKALALKCLGKDDQQVMQIVLSNMKEILGPDVNYEFFRGVYKTVNEELLHMRSQIGNTLKFAPVSENANTPTTNPVHSNTVDQHHGISHAFSQESFGGNNSGNVETSSQSSNNRGPFSGGSQWKHFPSNSVEQSWAGHSTDNMYSQGTFQSTNFGNVNNTIESSNMHGTFPSGSHDQPSYSNTVEQSWASHPAGNAHSQGSFRSNNFGNNKSSEQPSNTLSPSPYGSQRNRFHSRWDSHPTNNANSQQSFSSSMQGASHRSANAYSQASNRNRNKMRGTFHDGTERKPFHSDVVKQRQANHPTSNSRPKKKSRRERREIKFQRSKALQNVGKGPGSFSGASHGKRSRSNLIQVDQIRSSAGSNKTPSTGNHSLGARISAGNSKTPTPRTDSCSLLGARSSTGKKKKSSVVNNLSLRSVLDGLKLKLGEAASSASPSLDNSTPKQPYRF